MKALRQLLPKSAVTSLAIALSLLYVSPAQAADGCKFLLCIAGPWSSISQCVPTVHEVFHDLARGRPFPTCDMSGASNTANNTWVDEASCPSMYRQYSENGFAGCTYPGRISVYINGGLWSQVYWNMLGSTSTWYSDAARTSMAQQPNLLPIEDAFLKDLTRWNSGQVAQCRSTGGTVAFDTFGAFQRCAYLGWSDSGG